MKGLFIPDTIPLQIDIMEDLYMKVKTIRRGDIFYYDFGNNPGSIQCGERPVLVLQDDDYNNNAQIGRAHV